MRMILKSGMVAVLATLWILPAYAENDRRVINIQAEAYREVANDEMQAVLYAELNEKDAATLAGKINKVMNQAIIIAKQYPAVKVKTGNQNTYPVYSDRKLLNWRGRAEIVLNSQDFKQTSDLIAKLQANLQLQDISFKVSEAQQRKVENELYVEASKAFQQRAQLLLAPWNASSYELVNLQLNTNSGYRPMMAMRAMDGFAQSAKIESQNVEAGNSEVRVTANGSIQLR